MEHQAYILFTTFYCSHFPSTLIWASWGYLLRNDLLPFCITEAATVITLEFHSYLSCKINWQSDSKTCRIKTKGAGSAAFIVKLCNESFLGKWACEDGLSFCCRDSYCSLHQRLCDEWQLIAECDSDLMAPHKKLIAVSVFGQYYREEKWRGGKNQIKECLISNHVRLSVCLWPNVSN